MEQYTIAHKIYGVIPLVATYLATDIGAGSILSDAASVFNKGIIVTISIASHSHCIYNQGTLYCP
ncbi:MAG: hypothetical protein NQ127_01500 [Candidatus Cardinium sp.]|nr:hypothetical protein [Candidatus Cardinium sp.]